jgi:hypothetical protein
MNNELTFIFPDEEEKIIFMRWFKSNGFDYLINESKTSVSCISDYEEFYEDDSKEFDLSLQDSYIELQ